MVDNLDFTREQKNFERINAKEFLKFTETRPENERYELINGKVYMMASANVGHQDIAGEIYRQLANYLRGKKCRVFIVALDVVLFKKDKGNKDGKEKSQNVGQPDVFVVCDPNKIAKKRIYGAPDFIIEVVSPSNKIHDYSKKFELYKTCAL
jgi:Uma2 family endonuclease